MLMIPPLLIPMATKALPIVIKVASFAAKIFSHLIHSHVKTNIPDIVDTIYKTISPKRIENSEPLFPPVSTLDATKMIEEFEQNKKVIETLDQKNPKEIFIVELLTKRNRTLADTFITKFSMSNMENYIKEAEQSHALLKEKLPRKSHDNCNKVLAAQKKWASRNSELYVRYKQTMVDYLQQHSTLDQLSSGTKNKQAIQATPSNKSDPNKNRP